MTAGEKLQKLRLQNNMTQAQLGSLIGLNRTTISHYEHSYRDLTPNMRNWIAKKLNVNPTELQSD